MSKKMMKRSLALGALMAFVITGSAMAAKVELTTNEDVQVHTPSPYQYTTSMYYGNEYTLGEDEVKLVSTGTPHVVLGRQDENTTVYVGEKQTLRLEGDSNSEFGLIQDTTITGSGTVEIIKNGSGWGAAAIGTNYSNGNQIDITANSIKLKSGWDTIYLSNSNDKVKLTANYIEISGSIPVYAAGNNSVVDIKAGTEMKITTTESTAVRAGVSSNVTIGSTEGNKADITIDGDVETVYTSDTDGGQLEIKLETEKSTLNGRVKSWSSTDGGGATRDILLANGAKWNNTGASNVTQLTLDGGIVDNTANKSVGTDQIEVGTLSGNGTLLVADATANQMVVTDKADGAELTVSTTSKDVELEDLVGVATLSSNPQESAANYVEKTDGDIYSSEKAAVIGGNKIGEILKTVDEANIAVSDMAALGLMSWRAETNDMNKRMGELRNANGEHGVWVRAVGGEDEYKSVEYDYTQYQLGYDEKLSTDPSWTVGVALSYTDGESKFAKGSSENENKGVAIYGSKLNADGSFIDLIAKYSRMENDFKTIGGMGDADYSTNGYSFSAEYGKRIQQGNGLWIEPQVELTYGRVADVDYVTAKGVKVAQDSMESIVGRVGFSLGKDIKQGNVYARASYLYDFDGETSVSLGGQENLEQDLGGGWWEVGVGANINLSKATYVYADVEKTFGGEVDTNWQWNLGVRYSF